MSNLIVPNPGRSQKSGPALKRLNDKPQLLAGWIEDTERTLAAHQAWLDQLKRWQSQEQVSGREFEAAYALLQSTRLEEWAMLGLDKLRATVTGEEVAK
ncbi:MAG: hypothetical protein U0350_38560 [Caldilineaceae bacterium]